MGSHCDDCSALTPAPVRTPQDISATGDLFDAAFERRFVEGAERTAVQAMVDRAIDAVRRRGVIPGGVPVPGAEGGGRSAAAPVHGREAGGAGPAHGALPARLRDQLAAERTRVVDHLLPLRHALRGDAQVFPVAVEIRLP